MRNALPAAAMMVDPVGRWEIEMERERRRRGNRSDGEMEIVIE